VALFASVPLTDEIWIPFTEGELVAACGGQIIARQLADDALVVYGVSSDDPFPQTPGAAMDRTGSYTKL
jgi:hypothetical protein